MSKKHTNTCYDCIHYDICYKIEHFGRDLETNIPCKEFIGVSDRVEVVRCKDCKYCEKFVDDFGVAKYFCVYFCGSQETIPDGYCHRGRKNEMGVCINHDGFIPKELLSTWKKDKLSIKKLVK